MRSRPFLLLAVLLVLAALVAAISPALAIETAFTDVPSSYPYAQAIGDLADRHIINGFTDGSFGPDRPVTRQQFAKMILLSLGMTPAEDDWPNTAAPFVDMGADDPGSLYPHEYVALAALNQITKGKDATHFAPLDNINRAQVITMVVRAAQRFYPQTVPVPGNVSSSTWGDFDPTHAQNAAIAEANGLLAGLGADATHPSGDLSTLQPFGRMTRGEVAQVLHNLLALMEQTGSTTTSSSTTTTTSSTTTTTSSTTTTTTPSGATGDLLHFYWRAADGWMVENISALTGAKVAGPPVSVADMPGTLGAEVLMAKGSAEQLLAFAEAAQPPWQWQAYNMALGPDRDIAGPLATWRTYDNPDTRVYTHLAGPAVNGDLLHFWWGRDGGAQLPFSSENVSTLTGQKVQGELAPYVTSWGADDEAEHVAARSHANDLLVFWDVAPQHNWKVVNVSSITGRKIKDSPVAWVDYAGPGTTEDHLAAVGLDGHLLHFYWTAADGWKVEDISAAFSTNPLAGSVVRWGEPISSGQLGFESLAAVDTSGSLLHFCWDRNSSNPSWQMENVSAATGRQVRGPIAFYADSNPTGDHFDHVVAEGLNGDLYIFWCDRLKHNWKLVDLTAITGERMQGAFTTWVWYNVIQENTSHLVGVKR